jgi:gamma-glutamylcyclotransferase (GGCT)/AIG2-like uncharacterized protein YtfP
MLVDAGWGASLGYPVLVLDPAGSAIGGDVFESVDLPAHSARLDTFEGPGYERVATTVHIPTGDVDAYIYVLVRVQGRGLVEPAGVPRTALGAWSPTDIVSTSLD